MIPVFVFIEVHSLLSFVSIQTSEKRDWMLNLIDDTTFEKARPLW